MDRLRKCVPEFWGCPAERSEPRGGTTGWRCGEEVGGGRWKSKSGHVGVMEDREVWWCDVVQRLRGEQKLTWDGSEYREQNRIISVTHRSNVSHSHKGLCPPCTSQYAV